jgi:hypothetical protein
MTANTAICTARARSRNRFCKSYLHGVSLRSEPQEQLHEKYE